MTLIGMDHLGMVDDKKTIEMWSHIKVINYVSMW